MLTKRSFFCHAAAIIAAVALAPEIAFGVKLPIQPKLDLNQIFTLFYDLVRKRKTVSTIEIFATPRQVESLKRDYPEAFAMLYQVA